MVLMDWPELRLRLTLRLHRAWPFRVLSWLRERGVPEEVGFGVFRREQTVPIADVVAVLRAEIAALEAAATAKRTEVDVETLHDDVETSGAAPQLRQRLRPIRADTPGNLAMGQSAPLVVTTPEAARALMLRDVAAGCIEQPDVANARAFIVDAERSDADRGAWPPSAGS